LQTTDAPDVAALGREVVRRLDLTVVAKLDFERAPDGTLRHLEINPRFTLWTTSRRSPGSICPRWCTPTSRGSPDRPRLASGPVSAGRRPGRTCAS
jgi:hypothetical protein